MVTVKIKKLHNKAKIPRIATGGSACFDLSVCDDITVVNGNVTRAKTGIAVEIPEGYHVEVYPRSGLAGRGIIIPNSPGIIDSDYRGEVIVNLYGLFVNKAEFFGRGSRIAQARLVKNEATNFKVVSKLSETDRGTGGFGSTGVK
jgi:dUTP pyrophosphatase